jgi:predicted nucleic acid-binding protein
VHTHHVAGSLPRRAAGAQIIERLRGATNHSAHQFWPDDTSIVDAQSMDGTRVHSARQITDTYLLALALKHGGRLMTFDAGIALAAVKGATATHLTTLV